MDLIGTDFEAFYQKDGQVIPSLVVFEQQDIVKMRRVYKRIPNEINSEGYSSLLLKGDTFTLIEDGLAFEVPIDPAVEPAELCANISAGLQAAKEVGDSIGAELIASPLVYFDEDYLKTQAELTVLGCSPDENVYDLGDSGGPAQDPTKTAWRTGGGHIHFSIRGMLGDFAMIQALVMVCDATLGIADVVLEHGDLGKQRREMYGQPGKFRIQPHGVEYRTPSNAWVAHPESALLYLSLAREVHKLFIDNQLEDIAAPTSMDRVIQVIDACEVTGAQDLLEKSGSLYNLKSCKEIARIGDLGGVSKVFGYKMEAWNNG